MKTLDRFNRFIRFIRRGRPATVDGTKWRWRCGHGGHVVAYSEHGERHCVAAWKLMGINPDTFDKGQWKGTVDGMLCPSHVVKWLRSKKI